jgi:nucleotide-binding universal stress UspA family protein
VLPVEISCRNRSGVISAQAEAGRLCAYCVEQQLDGTQRPEHPLAAALRSSIRVYCVCDPCNTWAGIEVDQWFLDDPFVLELRSSLDVRDPRHPDRPIPSPLLRGHDENGIWIASDADGNPRMPDGGIVDDGDGTFRVIAASQERAEEILDKFRRRAEAAGWKVEFGEWQTEDVRPAITGTLKVRPWRWRRAVAKAALACAAEVFDEAWRTGPDAARLREWMRDPKALPYDHCPLRNVSDSIFAHVVPPPSNAVFFTRSEAGGVVANIVLLGTQLAQIVVDSEGRALPTRAWLTDPARPNGDPRMTYAELTSGLAAERLRS